MSHHIVMLNQNWCSLSHNSLPPSSWNESRLGAMQPPLSSCRSPINYLPSSSSHRISSCLQYPHEVSVWRHMHHMKKHCAHRGTQSRIQLLVAILSLALQNCYLMCAKMIKILPGYHYSRELVIITGSVMWYKPCLQVVHCPGLCSYVRGVLTSSRG